DSPFQQTSSLKPYVPNVILEKIIIDLEDKVLNLLEKEKANLEIIKSLKSKECDKEENPKVIAPGIFKLNVSECVSPNSMSKSSCDSNNVEIKLKRKRLCSKHMTGNHALLTNFVEKFLGTVRFGSNDFAEERYEYIIRYSALFDNDKQHRKHIADQEILFDKMSVELVELDKHVRDLKNTVLEKGFKISELEECVCNKYLEIEKCLERLNVCENKIHKMGQTNQTVHMIMPSKDNLYNGRKGIGFENPSYFEKAKDLRPSLYDEKIIDSGCSKHMTVNHALLTNFVEKFLGTVRFGNNVFAVIAGYGEEKTPPPENTKKGAFEAG
nr:integrase, catalytic region, zinc finger, CCHC-type, peptidase aspartic, catalytic [Tanacetum cinerariifolium]